MNELTDGVNNSIETYRALREAYQATNVIRPMRINRYEAGDELVYKVIGVCPASEATLKLVVERFVGGGFAGQVYRA
ncbi:MAG: hypothetical protein J7L99_05210, partial [Planctomycetes bacterium]|nr:hypothetical protein [Planctomycetota bacterium]